PDIGHVTLERGRAELRLRVPDVAVVACPEGDGVVRPGTHRRAVTVGPVHADLSGALVVDVAARGAHEEAVALARVDLGALFVEAEAVDPSRVLAGPRILHAIRNAPVPRAPCVEHEGAILGSEARNGVRADRAAREAVSDRDLVEVRRAAQRV